MTRLDPFERAFGMLAAGRFPAIRDEVEVLERDTVDRARFMALDTVQRLLTEIEPTEIRAQIPEATAEYTTALYVAYRYWKAGRLRFDLERSALELRLGLEPSEWPDVPHGACYLRLPERWMWAQIGPAEPHEPVDGLYIVRDRDSDELTTMAVLGLRADRAGFGQVTVTTAASDLHSAFAERRTPPFAPVLDGGEAAGLRSIVTFGELLQLATTGLLLVTESTDS